MAQALPGVNVVNLPLWIGYRIAGLPGALASAAGVIFPPVGILTMMAIGYSFLSRYPQTKFAFAGAAAAAIGLSGAMGLRAARRQVRKLVPAVILALTFVAVGVLRLPMLVVVGVLAPISIGFAYYEARR
jgi:chromate transporter